MHLCREIRFTHRKRYIVGKIIESSRSWQSAKFTIIIVWSESMIAIPLNIYGSQIRSEDPSSPEQVLRDLQAIIVINENHILLNVLIRIAFFHLRCWLKLFSLPRVWILFLIVIYFCNFVRLHLRFTDTSLSKYTSVSFCGWFVKPLVKSSKLLPFSMTPGLLK